MSKGGPAPKAPDRRQDRHQSRAQIVPLSGGLEQIPAPPRGISKGTQARWETFWGSEVSMATTEVDLPAIRRLFTYYDEWDRALREFRKQRYVEGSQKQPRLNPMAEHMDRLERLIGRLEGELGLTPFSRMRLGIAMGQAQKTLEEMNRSVDADEDEAETEDSDPRATLDTGPPRRVSAEG